MSCSCKIGGGPNGVCLECRRAANFNARLKKLESSREDAIAEGRRLERAAIVADLRRKAVTVANIRARVGMVALSATTERTFEALADLYERGEHEEGK